MKQIFAIIFLSFLCLGCSHLTGRQPKINQGNTLQPDRVAMLKVGQKASQVRNLLGDPLILPWRQGEHEVWEYIHYQAKFSKTPSQQRLTLLFKDKKLVKITPHS